MKRKPCTFEGKWNHHNVFDHGVDGTRQVWIKLRFSSLFASAKIGDLDLILAGVLKGGLGGSKVLRGAITTLMYPPYFLENTNVCLAC